MEGNANCVPDDGLLARQLKISANEARAKKQLEDELEAQRRKLEMEKLAELAGLRQKEELRRFGERLDAFLRQRRVKREFAQDNTIDEIQARIEDLEHAAEVLVKNSQQQHALAQQVLTKKQAEHHVVARKQLIQHKHDLDLLALMKAKVDDLLSVARADAEKLYKNPKHGYKPRKAAAAPKPPAPAASAPAAPPKPAPDTALFEDESEADAVLLQTGEGDEAEADAEADAEQKVMVDAEGFPVLPMSPPADLNAPLDPILTVPAAAAPAAPMQAPASPMRFAEHDVEHDDEADADADEEDSTEEFGSVPAVEQVAQLPTEQSVAAAETARFAAAESEDSADAEMDAEDAASAEPASFQPEMSARSQLDALPLEAELI